MESLGGCLLEDLPHDLFVSEAGDKPAQDHMVDVRDGIGAVADREVAQVGRALQAGHVLAHVLGLPLEHLEVVAEVEERADGLDCEVIDLGENFLLRGGGNNAHVLEVVLELLAAA